MDLPRTPAVEASCERFIPEFNALISEINDKLAQPGVEATEEARGAPVECRSRTPCMPLLFRVCWPSCPRRMQSALGRFAKTQGLLFVSRNSASLAQTLTHGDVNGNDSEETHDITEAGTCPASFVHSCSWTATPMATSRR